jgi:hypothetical protein
LKVRVILYEIKALAFDRLCLSNEELLIAYPTLAIVVRPTLAVVVRPILAVVGRLTNNQTSSFQLSMFRISQVF